MLNNPHRLAWLTMLSGLAIFSLLCGGSIVFTRWLLLESPTQLSVVLHVGRNTISLARPDSDGESAIKEDAQVGRHYRLSTDNLAEGYLSFADPYSGDMLATVTIDSSSVVTMENAVRPRFSLSDNPYAIQLGGTNGRLEVWLRDGLDREMRFDINGPLGTIRISEGGMYLIDSTPTYIKISTQQGSATLIAADRRTQHVAAGSEALLLASDQSIRIGNAPLNLLTDSQFVQANESEWPVGWSCGWRPSSDAPNAPEGDFKFERLDGLSVISLERLLPSYDPGAIGCIQTLGEPGTGLEVAPYTSLTLRVRLMVLEQYLSGCGQVGSECPLMLHMTYKDIDGTDRDWYHGFYVNFTPNVGGLTKCDSCYEDHDRINSGAWYTYEGDLFAKIPAAYRPGTVTSIEFYASGHRFDVLVDEVSLLATLPTSNTIVALTQ
ncbi:hypothetical protein [Aggregatilinea lenta]|uniref:hypothetical protein n=1 Tax=Aggregatilinea lenta TaxID=913108 RepID=UPI000E5C3420|nr:hypothetical protein [Aggregatilinea lenta]